MPRAVLYARVSTRDQKTIPDQLADLRDYARLRDFTVVGEYSEKESGKRDTRPQRQEILSLAWKHKIDAVLVWKLDRWGRSIQDLINTIVDLGNHKVDFISCSDNLDLSTTNGRLFFHILCAFAEFERSTIVDRVKAGIEKARQRGSTFGRPATTRKYDKQVRALFAAGRSRYQIAAEVGISRRSVQRILKGGAKATS